MSVNQIINILQTLLTVLMTVVPPVLLALGCTQDPAGNLDCSQAMFSPKTLALIVTGLGIIKVTILPWFSPGGWIRNLFGERAVVAPGGTAAATAGTVSPVDVRKAA